MSPLSPGAEVEDISSSSSSPSPSSTVSLANKSKSSSSNRHVEETESRSSVRSSDSLFYRTGSFYPLLRNPFSNDSLLTTPSPANPYNDYIYLFSLSRVPHAYTQSYNPPTLVAWTPRTFLYSRVSVLTYGGRVTSTTPPFFRVTFTHLPDSREYPSAGRAPGFLTPSTVYNNPSQVEESDFGLVTSNLVGFVEVEPIVFRPARSLPTRDASECEPGEIPSSRHSFTARFFESGIPVDEHTSSTETQRQLAVYSSRSLQSSPPAADNSVPGEPNITSNDITSSTHETEGTNQPAASSSIGSVEVEPPSSPRSSPLVDEPERPTRSSFTIPHRTSREPTDFLQKYVLPALTNAITVNRDMIFSKGRPAEPDEFPFPIVVRCFTSPLHPPSYPSLTFSRVNNPNSEVQITIHEAANTVTRLTLMYVNVLFATGWVTFLIATTQNDADNADNYSQVWCIPIL